MLRYPIGCTYQEVTFLALPPLPRLEFQQKVQLFADEEKEVQRQMEIKEQKFVEADRELRLAKDASKEKQEQVRTFSCTDVCM